MQGSFEYKIEASAGQVALAIDLDALSARALGRLDRHLSGADLLKLTEDDPEAAHAAERLHTVLQHLGR